MKHILVTTSLFFMLLRVVAQPMGEMDTYLNSPKVSAFAKQYYNDEVKTGVNDTTKRIIDSLKTKNAVVRPFYILQVSKMLMYTDADLAQVLFRDCYVFLNRKPNELVEFLYCDSRYVLSDYKKYWATAMAYQLRKEHPGDAKEYIAKLQEDLLKKGKKNNRANIIAFFELVAARL